MDRQLAADLALFKACVEATDGVIDALERVNTNVEKMAETVDCTKSLVDAWVTICGKTRLTTAAPSKMRPRVCEPPPAGHEEQESMPPPQPPPQRKRAASVPVRGARRSTRNRNKNARLR